MFTTLLLFVLGCLGSTFVDRFRFSMRFSRYVSAGSDPASGDGEIRTLDPLLARQVLSQLSYTPTDAGLPSFEAIPFPILFSGLFNRWA